MDDPPSARQRVLKPLREALERFGAGLPAGERLEVEVLDIDLAGQFEMWHGDGRSNQRYLRDTTWPTIKLRYRLLEAGRVKREAQETVLDEQYLSRANAHPSNDPLRYEKNMLDAWYRERFGVKTLQSGTVP